MSKNHNILKNTVLMPKNHNILKNTVLMSKNHNILKNEALGIMAWQPLNVHEISCKHETRFHLFY